MGKKRCKCGYTRFEKVDITPVGCNDPQHFVRCGKCGLVVYSSTHIQPTSSYLQKVLTKCSILTGLGSRKA